MGLVSSLAPAAPSAPNGLSLTNITSAIQQYVVAPLAAFGLGGFVFNAQGEGIANLSADITDHYTEDNKSVQDQIAIHPKRVTLKGYVGELIYNCPGGGSSTLQTLASKLTSISSFLPVLSSSAQQIQSAIASPSSVSFASALSTTSNIYGLVQNLIGSFSGNTPNQQQAYAFFKALLQSGTLMGVQTPWEFMTNMAIESITAIQGQQSIFMTDFSITLKEIRIAQTSSTAFSVGGTGGALPPGGVAQAPLTAAQGSIPNSLGPSAGSSSFPGGITGAGGLAGIAAFAGIGK